MTLRKRTPPDPRHCLFRSCLDAFWRAERNAAVPDLPWGAGEAGALASFLRANPSVTAESFRKLLEFRLASDDHARGESPRVWLSSLTRYANGPLDRFKLPKGASFQAREARVGMAVQEICEEDDRATALSYWREVLRSHPLKYDREAPHWVRQEFAASQRPS